jgi:H+/Cl- antiporter ClcA
MLLIVGKATLTPSVLYDLVFFTGNKLWPLALIGVLGGFLGLLTSIVVLTRTHDDKIAKRGALLCALAFLLAVPLSLPVG